MFCVVRFERLFPLDTDSLCGGAVWRPYCRRVLRLEVGTQEDVVDNVRAWPALNRTLLERDPAILLSENMIVRVDAMMLYWL